MKTRLLNKIRSRFEWHFEDCEPSPLQIALGKPAPIVWTVIDKRRKCVIATRSSFRSTLLPVFITVAGFERTYDWFFRSDIRKQQRAAKAAYHRIKGHTYSFDEILKQAGIAPTN